MYLFKKVHCVCVSSSVLRASLIFISTPNACVCVCSLEGTEEKLRNRESRPEDLHIIAELREMVTEREALVKKLVVGSLWSVFHNNALLSGRTTLQTNGKGCGGLCCVVIVAPGNQENKQTSSRVASSGANSHSECSPATVTAPTSWWQGINGSYTLTEMLNFKIFSQVKKPFQEFHCRERLVKE